MNKGCTGRHEEAYRSTYHVDSLAGEERKILRFGVVYDVLIRRREQRNEDVEKDNRARKHPGPLSVSTEVAQT